MLSSKTPAIVSASWLLQQMPLCNTNIKLLDSSWTHDTAKHSDHDDYVREHIPGAIFFDLNRCIDPTPLLPRRLPDAACFGDYARKLGICRDHHLVIYDRSRIHASSRAWWTFRVFGHEYVSILDGGLVNWKLSGLSTESGQNYPKENGDFEIRMQTEFVSEFEDVVDVVKSNSRQIVDARRSEHFHGQSEEPSKYTIKSLSMMNQSMPKHMHKGHIPGSRNLHKDLLLDPDTKCFLDKDQLLKVFQDRGIDPAKPMVTLCYGGHSASLVNIAAYICGQEDTSMYYGSWTEWGQRAPADLIEGPDDV